jgi:hypothetical protein
MKKILFLFVVALLIYRCSSNPQEQPDIILPTEVGFKVLVDSSALCNDSMFIFLDFYGSPCAMMSNVVIDILNDTAESNFRIIIDTLPAHSICCFSDGKLFTVSQNKLRQFIDNKMQNILELPGENMLIEKAGEKRLYIYGQTRTNKDTLNMLYLYSTGTHNVVHFLSDRRNITAVAGNGDSTYIVLDNTQLFLLVNGKSERLLSNIPIKSITALNGKCFLATDDFVGVCYGKNKFIPFMKKGAKKLLCNGNELYILFNNGMLAELTDIYSFDIFLMKTDSLLTQKQIVSNQKY